MDFELVELLEEMRRRMSEGGWQQRYFSEPNTRDLYAKHWEFFDAGAEYRFRLFIAGNRTGKSLACGIETVQHLTGKYHDDWKGKRFDGPVNVWIVGKSAELVRQTLQPLLLGENGSFGTGLIPKDSLDLDSLTDAKKASTPINSFRVLHENGGYSTVSFKSGEQGREAFQAAALDIVWLDEEIPFDVMGECLVRLMTRKGILLYSFTPLKGLTDTVLSFSKDGQVIEGPGEGSKYVVQCSMDDVPHLSKEDIEQLLAQMPPFQRDARRRGIPQLGSGAIYPVPESEFVIEPQPIPAHWKRCYGMDVGNKTAAVWLAINPDDGQIWTYAEWYKEREEPSIHTAGIKAKGENIPGAIDPASRGRSQIDGQQLMQMYLDLGLNLSKAINAVESGLYTCWELLSTGRLKVFSNCTYLLSEFRTYRRDEKGNVIKTKDHVMDAWRYAVMTRDIAVVPERVNTQLSGLPTRGWRM
jgi:phage terminase large subunit-like protein